MSERNLEQRLQKARGDWARLGARLRQHFLGSGDTVELVSLALLADGHVLLEGAPGLGKTTLVRALAAALDLDFQRVQCTPDLMPGDILGTRILEEQDGVRRFVPVRGPIFTNLLLADEINRATPRTQSALLEAMAERQVTLFGERNVLPPPFLVVATQNPIEMEGTYPLPEAQLDRFLVKLELASPGEEDLLAVLKADPMGQTPDVSPCLDRADLLDMQQLARRFPAPESVLRLAARVVLCTDPRRTESPPRVRQALRYGASPRGAQAMVALARGRALLAGRLVVTPEDLRAVAKPALRHRLVMSYEGEALELHPDDLVQDALQAAGLP